MKSRILVILGCNTRWAPYYYRYENIFIKNGISFDVAIWNRENIIETLRANIVYEFKKQDTSNDHNFLKVGKFIKFANFIKKIIAHEKYEKLIFLGWAGCAATLNWTLLVGKYKNKYWLDIRDSHYEWFFPYFLLEKAVINNSSVTTISSLGFRKFLPDHEYYINHNIAADLENVATKFRRNVDTCIRISFIGNVRYFEENKQLLKVFANDHRFRLQYYGFGSDKIKEFCLRDGINNVDFYGEFDKNDTVLFYNRTDIINNVYGNKKIETKSALSNKLYYGLYFKLPILVSPGTYMEEIVNEYGIGMAFENDVSFPDILYSWYMDKIHKQDFDNNYLKLWSKVVSEQKITDEMLLRFLHDR